MTESELKDIIAKGESARVTFFKSVPSAETLARQIVKFSNKYGGTIIIGVDELRRPYSISSGVISTCLNAALAMISGNPVVTREVVKVNGHRLQVLKVAKPAPTPIQVISDNKNIKGHNPKVTILNQELNPSMDESEPSVAEFSSHQGIPSKNEDTNSETDTTLSEPVQILEYRNTRIEKDLSDLGIAPCFGVDTLANAFFNLIRHTSSDGENICFLGVFGKWGRGKSFFLNRLKDSASKSVYSNFFDFVTFNAWKYQKTPEIWASLIHTLIQHKGWIGRLRFRMSWRVLLAFIGSFLFLGIAAVCIILTISEWNSEGDKSILTVIASGVSLFLSIFGFVQSFGLVDRQEGRRYRASDLMGVQFHTENELVRILKRWNWGHHSNPWRRWRDKSRTKRKIVLCVEDIDRCDDHAMLSIIEALKLIMENPEIAKRMIVVVSLDAERLISAYERKATGSDEYLQKSFAIEQLNKIFLMGINLPSISYDDMEGYIAALGNRLLGTPKIVSFEELKDEFKLDTMPFLGLPDLSILAPDNPLVPEHNPSDLPRIEQIVQNIDFEASIRLLSGILMGEYRYSSVKHWTPRQVLIIFYRLILANNISHDLGFSLSEQLYRIIIGGSTSNSYLAPTQEEAMILEICNPYPVVAPIKDPFNPE